MSNSPKDNQVTAVIIGAGTGGLTAGVALRRQLKFYDFKIFEQSSDIGGTWNDNTYPGAACDSDVHWYSLSSDLNPYWKESHASQAELKSYWKQIAIKYSLYDHLVLNTRVVSADWNDNRQVYRICLQDTRTKELSYQDANVMISAVGILSIPYCPPDLEGVKTFNGPHFHSSRWDNSLDLRNKRVAVFGNACSGSQLIPIITSDPSIQVTNFCKTAPWYAPLGKQVFSERWKWYLGHIPFAACMYRYWIMAKQERMYLMILAENAAKFGIDTRKTLETFMKAEAPPEYYDRVIPTYPVGCKRIVLDNGYLAALHRPNFDVNYDGVEKFTETGLVTRKGDEYTFDVMVLATGFVMDEAPLNLRGVDGITIQEYYNRKGGPEAYLGVTLPGFPNFFMIAGPNTVTGHASMIFAHETQANYIVQLIRPIIQGLASSFDVKPEANDLYNAELQNKLSASVWSRDCTSWYRTRGAGPRKIFGPWPGTITQYWWRLRSPVWSDYKVSGGEKWVRRRKLLKSARMVAVLGAVGLGVWGYQNKEEVMDILNSFCEKVLDALMNARLLAPLPWWST